MRYPLPLPPTVTGSYGEIRGTSLHLGLDLATGETIGEIPVLAAADGYVYRIRISHSGYGKVLYVQHAGGLRTVYGHLSHLAPQGEAIIQALQSHQRRFEVETVLDSGAWRVRAGDTIAWAGNSGYSFGPHLHFEVRDRADRTYPPYTFLGLTDSEPPVFMRFGVVSLDQRSLGKSRYHFFRLGLRSQTTSRRVYAIRETLSVRGPVGFVYTVGDRLGGGRAWSGVAQVALYEGDKLLYRVRWDTLDYDWRRFVRWHIDEPYNRLYRVGLERLYRPKGWDFPWTQGDGRIALSPGEVRSYLVVAEDFLGNRAEVSVVLRGSSGASSSLALPFDPARLWAIESGFLLSRRPFGVDFGEGALDSVTPMRPLWLGGRRPVRLLAARETLSIPLVATLFPGHPATIPLASGCTLRFFPETLSDTLYLIAYPIETPMGVGWVIGDPLDGLRYPAELVWQWSGPQWAKAVPLYRGRQGGWDVVQGYTRHGLTLRIPVRQWGTYAILVDTIAPSVRPLGRRGPYYLVSVEDFGSGVDPYSLSVQGERGALYPEYYAPQRRLYLPRSAGRAFRIRVRDRVGNTREARVCF